MRLNPDDAQLFERELLGKLRVDLTQVLSGSVSVEGEGGSDKVQIRWTGAATIPAAVLREWFNQLRIRGES